MKKNHICGGGLEPDCQSAGSTVIKTVAGPEKAIVDLETGEVRYAPVKNAEGCPGGNSADLDKNKRRAAGKER